MDAFLLMVIPFVGYLVAYHTYGRFLGRKIFQLREDAPTPAVEQEDGVDFVPTHRDIIFGHHYTSIAGTGPIVGPAIGIIWGWVPALVWVFVGSIAMGAVHDMGTMVVSMRNNGESLSECAGRYVGVRVRYIFFLIIFLLLLIVIAVFGIVIAAVFKLYPQSVFPVWMEIPIAMALGWAVYKKKLNIKLPTILAVAAMYVTVALGHLMPPITMPGIGGIPATGMWVIVLLVYAFLASCLPVTTLLQPRDYINAWQLFIAMGLLILGVAAASFGGQLSIVAPAFNLKPEGAPPIVPFLFITIACGAISGFHSLVASGTTSKQISKETDARFVGYGSMLLEGALAVLVIIAVAAGIGMAHKIDGTMYHGAEAWQRHYASWSAVTGHGLSGKLEAMVVGSANMLQSLHIPHGLGLVIIGVFIASFAGTTLDTATRIQRYVVAELCSDIGLKPLANRYAATALAVLTAAGLAFATGADGTGAMKLWPLFGAANQLIAAMALLIVTNYLLKKGGYGFLVTAVPCLFMLIITAWAVTINERNFINKNQWLLAVVNGGVLLLSLWMAVECVISGWKTFQQKK
jgi:carbon starvation protein